MNPKYDLYKLSEAEREEKVKVNKSQIARELGIKTCYMLFKKKMQTVSTMPVIVLVQ